MAKENHKIILNSPSCPLNFEIVIKGLRIKAYPLVLKKPHT